MNVDAAGQFDPAHLEKWWMVTCASCLACHQAFRKPFQEHFYGKAEVRQ